METIGSIVDKLTTSRAKAWHLQAQLKGASPGHAAHCKERVAVVERQADDLTVELDELVDDVRAGRKRLKVYRQCKLYNDPRYRQ